MTAEQLSDLSVSSPLSPVLEVDDVRSLQACLQEVAQFYVLGCRARLWAAILNPRWQCLQKETYGDKDIHTKLLIIIELKMSSDEFNVLPLKSSHIYNNTT